MVETLHTTWRREVVSPEGFSVRLTARNTLTYKDTLGELEMASEPMAGSGITVTVYSESTLTRDRGRAQVMDDIARAFRHAGWVMIPS